MDLMDREVKSKPLLPGFKPWLPGSDIMELPVRKVVPKSILISSQDGNLDALVRSRDSTDVEVDGPPASDKPGLREPPQQVVDVGKILEGWERHRPRQRVLVVHQDSG